MPAHARRHPLLALALVPLAAALAGAQAPPGGAGGGATPLPPLLPESTEVALALSAAPPDVSRGAAVWVLRRGGFVKAREGTGEAAGMTCLVQRDNPESLYPLCYDAEASRTILPIALEKQRLREAGRSWEEIDREVEAAIAAGRFAVPRHVAVSYMMSPGQVLFAGPTGRRVGRWYPHVMLYLPNASAAQMGLTPAAQRVVGVADGGKPTAHVVVKVPAWSDGTPVGTPVGTP